MTGMRRQSRGGTRNETRNPIPDRPRPQFALPASLADRAACAGCESREAAATHSACAGGGVRNGVWDGACMVAIMINPLFLDCESIKGVLPSDLHKRIEGIEYALSWKEEAARGYAGMGLACVCAATMGNVDYAYIMDGPQKNYTASWNLPALLNTHDPIVTFGGESFDFPLLATNGFPVDPAKSFDFRVEIHEALHLAPGEHSGVTLASLALVNGLDDQKSEDSGGMAPVLWQRGEYDRVVAACMQDVQILKQLWIRVLEGSSLFIEEQKAVDIETPDPRKFWPTRN